MGDLKRHDIQFYIDKFNLDTYIETGTGEGVTLQHALQFKFKNVYSIEIFEEIYKTAVEKFKNDNCQILLGNSYEILKNLLPKLNNNKILFFLDAHFPGADFHYTKYDDEKDMDKRLPLYKELHNIINIYNVIGSVFIIDDLRIYEDGPFEAGNWCDRKKMGGNGIKFIYEMFEKTHNIVKDYRDQGYIILTPK